MADSTTNISINNNNSESENGKECEITPNKATTLLIAQLLSEDRRSKRVSKRPIRFSPDVTGIKRSSASIWGIDKREVKKIKQMPLSPEKKKKRPEKQKKTESTVTVVEQKEDTGVSSSASVVSLIPFFVPGVNLKDYLNIENVMKLPIECQKELMQFLPSVDQAYDEEGMPKPPFGALTEQIYKDACYYFREELLRNDMLNEDGSMKHLVSEFKTLPGFVFNGGGSGENSAKKENQSTDLLSNNVDIKQMQLSPEKNKKQPEKEKISESTVTLVDQKEGASSSASGVSLVPFFMPGVNLKDYLNIENVMKLPIECQKELMQLLPSVDQAYDEEGMPKPRFGVLTEQIYKDACFYFREELLRNDMLNDDGSMKHQVSEFKTLSGFLFKCSGENSAKEENQSEIRNETG